MSGPLQNLTKNITFPYPRKPPAQINWGTRRGKPWSDDEVGQARFLRHCGMTDKEIGAELKRTTLSVSGKLGYVRKSARVGLP